MAFPILLLLGLMQANPYVPARLQRTVPFDHPLNIIASSWVALDVEVDREGNARSVERIQGENPFLDIAVGSVRRWAFSPARSPMPTESHVTVVFLFRARELFSASPLQLPPANPRNTERPALPLQLSDPGYPVTSVGEGQTVVELQIGDSGSIQSSRVVSDVPGLATHTDSVLRSWKFQPAMREGKAAAGTVIAVVSYLRPVTVIGTPSTGGPTPNPPGPPPNPPTGGRVIRPASPPPPSGPAQPR